MGCVFVTGPGGVDLSTAIVRIATGAERECHTTSIESALKRTHLQQSSGDVSRDSIATDGGLQHVLANPKDYVQRIWMEAFRERLGECRDDCLNLIGMHAAYFSPQSEDFFQPYLPSALASNISGDAREVSCIITVIDDIYDVYRRLREPRHLFDDPVSAPDAEEDSGLASIVNAVTKHFLLLNWRATEISAARSMSRSIGCPHYVIAAKHPTQVALEAIANNKIPVYLSHPISAARNLLNAGETERANAIIEDIERMSSSLMRSESVYPFLPTTIDEYRLRTEEAGNHLPRLGARWPRDPYEETMFEPPRLAELQPLDPEDRWEVIGEAPRAAVAPLLRVLIDRIAQEINARDRMLVEQSRGLILLRPYADERMSWGMLEEIKHRTRLVEYEVAPARYRRALIINPPGERAGWRVKRLLENLESDVVTEEGGLSNEQLTRLDEALRECDAVMRGLERGDLEGGVLRRCCTAALDVGISFRGIPDYNDVLAGVREVRRQRWIDEKWSELARRAVNREYVIEQSLEPDRVLNEVPEPDVIAVQVEEMFADVS